MSKGEAFILNLIKELEGYGVRKEYTHGDCFVKKGQMPTKFAIVKKGLFRYYYLTREGKEYTKVFMPEGSILSSYSAMVNKAESHFNIEAIEESTVIEITYRKWNELRSEDSKWNKLLISFLEKGYQTKEKREREFLLLDAEGRYREFMNDYPLLINRVKQHLIASYLGITPIALSRVRKKMKIINLG
jgi:CRP-like cAMP-binding protein